MAHHDKDLQIALRRLNELRDRSRRVLEQIEYKYQGISTSELKKKYDEALQRYQDSINEIEDKLSSNPETVEDTQLK